MSEWSLTACIRCECDSGIEVELGGALCEEAP
jgi:hypothetical protein